MAFTLQVKFQGLCAFVPRRNGHRAWALMVNEKTADTDTSRKKLQRHIPAVSFSLGDLYPRVKDSDNVRCHRQLDFSDVFILPGGREEFKTDEQLSIVGFPADGNDLDLSIPETTSDSRSFANLACLERACLGRGHRRGGGEVIPELLQPTLTSFKDILAARIHLTAGKLGTQGLGTDRSRQAVVVWRFKPYKAEDSASDHRQILAATVVLELPIEDDFVRLEARDISNNSNLQFAVDLKGETDKKIEVDIFNEEVEQFFARDRELEPKIRLGKAKKGDRILESYYRLARNGPSVGDRPIPIADHFIFSGGGADSSPPCSPVRFLSV